MKPSAPQAVLVVGMHRSGTSALAGSLSRLGVEFGPDLMPANATQENAKGFFEDRQIVRLHNLILGALHSKWDDPREEMPDWEQVDEVQPYREALKNRILDVFGQQGCWGVKDPRLCLLLPLWESILTEIGHQPVILPVVRNPLEVARSLQRRNGFSLEKGFYLWMRYTRGMQQSGGMTCVPVCDYASLLADPVGALETLLKAGRIGGRTWSRGSIEASLGDFVSPDLRHQVSSPAEAPEDPIEMEVRTCYEGLLRGEKEAGSSALPPPSPELMEEHLNQVQADVAVIHEETVVFSAWIQALEAERRHMAETPYVEMGRYRMDLEALTRERDHLRRSLAQRHFPLWEGRDPVDQEVEFERDRANDHLNIARHFEWLYEGEKKARGELQGALASARAKMNLLEHSLVWEWSWSIRYVGACVMKFLGGASVHRIPWIARSVRCLPLRWRSGVTAPLLEGTLVLPPPAERPRVSIIIPVYGHMEVTMRCLESLAQVSTQVPFELIVVDDQSPDSTRAALSMVPNLQLLKNKQNVGFVESCNAGAALAKGDMLLFLNNDTEVRNGFLDELCRVFDAHADAGVVGGKLLYPDGSLQECGGIIWEDGDGWNYGNRQDPTGMDYQYLREVDFVSGACLMIPAELFRSLDGFDPVFAPGYYEDTDLAFRVREKGYKVYVQPRCEIIHHEGISSGTDTAGSGMKRYQEINRKTFAERWKHVLPHHPRHGDVEPERAIRHRCRYTILFVDSMMISPDKDAGSYRTAQLLRILQQEGAHLTFATLNVGYVERESRALEDAGIRVIYYPKVYSLKSYLEASGSQYDMVILSRLETVCDIRPWVRTYCPDAMLVYDTVDLHFLREQREADLRNCADLRASAEQTRNTELENIQASDVTLVVSPAEQEVLAEAVPDADVRILPTIFNCDPTPSGLEARSGIVFIGSFAHPPNTDAMLFFIREVMPLLRRQHPGIRLTVLGPNPPEEILDLAGEDVEVTGWVEDVRPYFESTRLTVAPLRFGAGVKGKINMSLSWGVPVVGTPVACEGMYLEHRQSAMIADTPDTLAEAVVDLYTQSALWNTLREGGLKEMEARFSTESARPVVKGLLKEIRT